MSVKDKLEKQETRLMAFQKELELLAEKYNGKVIYVAHKGTITDGYIVKIGIEYHVNID